MLGEHMFWDPLPKQARRESEEAAMMAAVRDVCLKLYETFGAICSVSGSRVRVTFSDCAETSNIFVSVSFTRLRSVDVATGEAQVPHWTPVLLCCLTVVL